MMISAGAVFQLSTIFESPDPLSGGGDYADYIYDATVGIDAAAMALQDHEPAMVFFHNNQAMLAFLLTSDEDMGICHLEKLRNLEDIPGFHGTEGRAAAPFTYGMVHDEAYVDYAIAMLEGCDSAVCNWTTKLAPFKPIGQLMTLAELHSIKATYATSPADQEAGQAEMELLLDRAVVLGAMLRFPFMDRIEALRSQLPTREYTDGMGMGRSPMPVYSNQTNCSLCHIGGLPGAFGEDLANPYPDANTWSPRPDPPPFKPPGPVSCDLTVGSTGTGSAPGGVP
jgi:mono/diheme cytochrome c family protein